MVASLIDGGYQSTQRKPQTCRKSRKNFSHNVILSTSRLSRVRTHNISGDNPNNYSFRVKLLHKCTNKIEKAVLIYLIISNLDIFFLWCHQWILSDIINELTLILKMICQCNVKYIIICTEFLSMMFLPNKNHKNWYSKNKNDFKVYVQWGESNRFVDIGGIVEHHCLNFFFRTVVDFKIWQYIKRYFRTGKQLLLFWYK